MTLRSIWTLSHGRTSRCLLKAALDELAAQLDAMSGAEHAHLWTREALAGPEWQRVRAMARDVPSRSRACSAHDADRWRASTLEVSVRR